MTPENRELLFKDLCGRVPYEVIVCIDGTTNVKLASVSYWEEVEVQDGSRYLYDIADIKPYLFPLSSMTEEQTEEIHNLIYQGVSESVDETKEWLKTRKENDLRPITLTYILSYKLVIDWFCKNHFDYRGLIEKGLAIDCTGLNIY